MLSLKAILRLRHANDMWAKSRQRSANEAWTANLKIVYVVIH
jgi:hypothetical protein